MEHANLRKAIKIRMLKRIFGPKRDEGIREWRKIHSENLYVLYSSPNIVLFIKSRRMRLAGNVARVEMVEIYAECWWGNLRERNHLENPGVDERIILRRIFRKWDVGMEWIELAQDRDR